MRKNTILFLFLHLVMMTGFTQSAYVINGRITDVETGEVLIGASVFTPELGFGTVTNEYGFYSLTLPAEDSVTVKFSYIGYESLEKVFYLTADEKYNAALGSGVQLTEVTVEANSFKEDIRSTQMSVEAISTKEVKVIPVLFGESDILKTIQLKPGMPSGGEGTTGLYVRGGSADQNLILLDEAIVYNASHLFGFFSTFNTDAINDLSVYKGGFPAQYGGRLSSVIDVKLKEGNIKKFSVSGGLGLISSRLTVESPIIKDKMSFIVSGRRTYFDFITKQINKSNEKKGKTGVPIPDYYFYDINAKVNYKINDKDRIFLSGYFGKDDFGFKGNIFTFGFDWGNTTGTARWNHQYNSKLFSNTTFTYSDYKYNITNEVTGFVFNLGSGINDANLKMDFIYAHDNHHTLRFGVNGIAHNFSIGRFKFDSDNENLQFSAGKDLKSKETAVYVSDLFSLNKRFKINAGLRLSGFFFDDISYLGLEPRVAVNYTVNERFSLKGSYARMNQYLHLVANAGAGLPTDIWYPATKKIKPQKSDQIAIGLAYLLGDKFKITNEYYYKWLNNQVDFVDGAELFVNDNLEGEFVIGKGYGYGMELGIEKKSGDLTGWVGYTLSLIKKGDFKPVRPDAIFGMGERYFSPRYDRRHDVSIVASYKFSRRWTASFTWVYGSGDLTWLPNGRWTFQNVSGGETKYVVPDYGDRNNFRLAPFHRLDLGVIYTFFPKWGESDLTLNVINAYDRRNAFFVYIEPEYKDVTLPNGQEVKLPEKVAVKQASLFPVLPSISWNFKF